MTEEDDGNIFHIALAPDQWRGSIILSPQGGDAGGFTVEAYTAGGSNQAALEGAETILRLLTSGKQHAVRTSPEANSQINFETDKHEHKGYARFVLWDQPGERLEMKSPSEGTFVGFRLPTEGSGL